MNLVDIHAEGIFIFDIDGTVANGEHRKHWLKSQPKNWPAYMAGLPHDTPIIPVVKVYQSLIAAGAKVLFVSGRSEDERAGTEEWLCKHGFFDYIKLLMRPSKDYRADDIIKEEILRRDILPFYNVIAVFDDRPRVTKMWKKLGIFVFDVYQDPDRTEF